MVRPRIRANAPGTTLKGIPRRRTEWTRSRRSSSGRPSAPTRTMPRASVRSSISLKDPRSSAQEGEGGGEHYLCHAEAAHRVDHSPHAHEPRPAKRGPDEPSRAAPNRRPVVQTKSGEEDDPGRHQQRRQAEGGIWPTSEDPGRAFKPYQQRKPISQQQNEDTRQAPQQLEAEQPLRNVAQDPHGILRTEYTAAGQQVRSAIYTC